MTNAEKYLKDGANIEEFIQEIEEELDLFGGQFNVERWLRTSPTPTLNEDERVILRNLDAFYIGRKNGIGLYARFATCDNQEDWKHPLNCLNDDLFQFIKERRRIRDRGVIKWK